MVFARLSRRVSALVRASPLLNPRFWLLLTYGVRPFLQGIVTLPIGTSGTKATTAMTATTPSTTHLLTDLTSKELVEDRNKSSESMEDGFSPKVEGATIAQQPCDRERTTTRIITYLAWKAISLSTSPFHRVIEESSIFRQGRKQEIRKLISRVTRALADRPPTPAFRRLSVFLPI